MKTARSIEEQPERKAARDNRADDRDSGGSSRELTQPVTPKSKRGDASRIAAWRWPKGKSANPGGKPKVDLSAEIARGIFENNQDIIYAAFVKMLKRGNAYAYQVLSDRAYGKLRETHAVEVGRYPDMSNEDLEKRAAELERQLGLTPETRIAELERQLEQARALPPAADDSKPN